MALATYSDLQASVANWLGRAGDETVTAVIPDAIQLVESKLNRVLRVAQMEAYATGTSTNGALSLPDDYVSWRSVEASPYGPLEFVTPDYAAFAYPTGEGGTPKYFTIQGNTLTTFPAYSGELSISYYASIPALSDSNTANWLLTEFPDVYLFMTLVELNAFAKNPEAASLWNDRAAAAVDELKAHDRSMRYASVTVRVKGPTP